MLLHSHNDEIKLLPALPEEWPTGHVRGLRARGDYTVDIEWDAGRLAKAVIYAGEASAGSVRVVYADEAKRIEIAPGSRRSLSPADF